MRRPLPLARFCVFVFGFVVALVGPACQCGPSEAEQRERALILVDRAVDKALGLGLAGLADAVDGGLGPRSEAGDLQGSMTVSGTADALDAGEQSLHLRVQMTDYSDIPKEDDVDVRFDSYASAPPRLELVLKDAPAGTFKGSFKGLLKASGQLEDNADVSVTLSGLLEEVAGAPGRTQRKDGTVRIVGSVSLSGGSIAVDSTR